MASRALRLLFKATSLLNCLPLWSAHNDHASYRCGSVPARRQAVGGLVQVSQIAIDKITVVPAAKIGGVIGNADDALLLRVNRALALFLSIA